MTTNIGMLDRALRVILGAALIAWAMGWVPGYGPSIWGWLGIIPLGTALVGSCPVYSLFGIATCKRA